MAAIPTDYKYYPSLSGLITVADLPEVLNFIKGDIDDIFNKTFFKDFQSSATVGGNSAFYSLSIVSVQKLQVEIPGTGLFLILNPDYIDNSITVFPITIFYRWDILALINYFNISNFSFSINDIFNLALKIFNVTEEDALITVASIFVNPTNIGITRLAQLVIDINSLYGSNINIDENSDDPYQDLIVQVGVINQEVFPTIFSLYLTAGDQSKLNSFFSSFYPADLKEYITDLILPKVRATLELTAALEFPRNYLLPMVQTANGYVPDNSLDVSGNLKQSYIQFGDAILDFDTSTGFGYQTEFAGTLYPTYAQIASTCLVISFSDVKLDLSTTSNIPEVDAAGYPTSFVGAYIKQASVIINGFGTDNSAQQSVSLTVKNFIVGTGGVSGIITFADNGVLYRNFGSFAAELDSFSVSFLHNAITASAITGKITIPRFTSNNQPAVINIQAAIKDNGDFSITALPSANAITISILNVLDVVVRKLSIGKEAKGFYVEVAGTLNFTADIPVLGEVLPKGIDIKKLRIWEDGSIEFAGGGLVLPKSFKISIGPVSLEVNKLSLGSYSKTLNGVERSYNYFGFDGMVNTGNAGLEVTGNGIKYYFTNDDGPGKPFDQSLSIAQIIIDLVIPSGASKDDADFILHGFLSMKNPDPSIPGSNAGTEYTGSVSFTIPSIDLSGSAGMRLTPSIPSFIVDIDLELSTPIPLGPTALGIYGFRGLIGEHYVPSKSATTPPLPETATWWEYYKAKSIITGQEGVQIDKFASKSGFSIGAGLTVATEFDTGFTFSARVFLLLGLPDVLLIQGQAGILQKRIGLDDKSDPPFSALIAIDSTSFQGDLGVDYRLPSGGSFDGKIFSLTGHLELAFFFNNLSAWYLNIGRDQPETARVRAKILTLFQG